MRPWHTIALLTGCVSALANTAGPADVLYDVVDGHTNYWNPYNEIGIPSDISYYGFQEALRDALSPGFQQQITTVSANGKLDSEVPVNDHTIILWSDGCHVPSNSTGIFDSLYGKGFRNCTEACLNLQSGADIVWNSAYSGATLHNCMVFPWIVALQSAGRLTPTAVEIAKRFNIANSTSIFGSDRWPVINACTKAYCQLSAAGHSDCLIEPQMTARSDYSLLDPSLDRNLWVLSINTTLCDHIAISVNSDLAGIGVLISYIVQLILVLISWILYQIRHGFIHLYWTRKRRSSPNPHETHLAALIATLDDFQKTQVFLTSTVQVATTVALHKLSLLASASPVQLQYNFDFMLLSATSGASTLVLVYSILRSTRPASVFMATLSMIAIALCFVTMMSAFLLTKFGGSPSYIKASTSKSQALEACGGFPPTGSCTITDQGSVDLPNPTVTIVVFSWIAGLIFDSIRFRNCRWLSRKEPLLSAFGTLLLQFSALGMILYSLISYVKILSLKRNASVKSTDWSLGQILAVAVWIPVIAEFANYSIFGIEEGSERKLIKPYKVVKQDDEQTDIDEQHGKDEARSVIRRLPTSAFIVERTCHSFMNNMCHDKKWFLAKLVLSCPRSIFQWNWWVFRHVDQSEDLPTYKTSLEE